MFPIKCISLLTFTSILFVKVNCEQGSVTDKSEAGIPTNPCAYTLCIENTTCIAIPVSETCRPGPTDQECEKRAMCIPHYPGKPGNLGVPCGSDGERCTIDQKCDLVPVQCLVAPCPEIRRCVPIIPNVGPTRSSSSSGSTSTNTIKFTKFVVGNNNVYIHQRQKGRGRPKPGKQTNIYVNSRPRPKASTE